MVLILTNIETRYYLNTIILGKSLS